MLYGVTLRQDEPGAHKGVCCHITQGCFPPSNSSKLIHSDAPIRYFTLSMEIWSPELPLIGSNDVTHLQGLTSGGRECNCYACGCHVSFKKFWTGTHGWLLGNQLIRSLTSKTSMTCLLACFMFATRELAISRLSSLLYTMLKLIVCYTELMY